MDGKCQVCLDNCGWAKLVNGSCTNLQEWKKCPDASQHAPQHRGKIDGIVNKGVRIEPEILPIDSEILQLNV